MIVTNPQPHRVSVSVYGEFTLSDYQEFEAAVNVELDAESPVDLCFDLREMNGATLDVAWEDLRFARRHVNDFRRIAVVTDSQWVTWSAWLSQVFLNAEIEVFETPEEALEWLDQ
ncbi:MAG: STAS/SEC14 domain-containing protein [Zoogloeaceae bacterium]|jgi:hypothetical protein|nr:STAS/SEC14 domain-containing protein [Zoogloeaceae bacterium]